MKDVIFRKATTDDCGQIYDLICDMESRALPFDRFHDIFCRQLNGRDYDCLVTEWENRVIGVLNLRFEAQLHHAERIAEILEFAINPAYRNRGVGKDMLEQAVQIAKEHGCSQIEVACNQLRKDAHRFYLREGMHRFHYKFSKALDGNDSAENAIGK